MKTRTVAYATQRVSSVATTRPRFHQGSVRSVLSEICARVRTGASEMCVIQRPCCLVPDRAHELIPVSPRMPHQGAVPGCEPRYTPRSSGPQGLLEERDLEQQQV